MQDESEEIVCVGEYRHLLLHLPPDIGQRYSVWSPQTLMLLLLLLLLLLMLLLLSWCGYDEQLVVVRCSDLIARSSLGRARIRLRGQCRSRWAGYCGRNVVVILVDDAATANGG
jgi:hypothetical protein